MAQTEEPKPSGICGRCGKPLDDHDGIMKGQLRCRR